MKVPKPNHSIAADSPPPSSSLETSIPSCTTVSISERSLPSPPSGGSVDSWPNVDHFLSYPPESGAVLSVWNSKEVFFLEVRGASRATRGLAKASQIVDKDFPWLGIPSVPELFMPFGFHCLYGLGGWKLFRSPLDLFVLIIKKGRGSKKPGQISNQVVQHLTPSQEIIGFYRSRN